ncbi:MAG: hypothetical protein ACI90V_003068 [Bacillariaceae sp.]|jgi:hypothetical protein
MQTARFAVVQHPPTKNRSAIMKHDNGRISTTLHGVDCWQEDSFVSLKQDEGFGDWASSSFGEDFFPADNKVTKPSNKSSTAVITATTTRASTRASTRTSSSTKRRSKSSNNRRSRHQSNSNSNSKEIEVSIDPPTPLVDTKNKEQRGGRPTNDNIDTPKIKEEKNSDIPRHSISSSSRIAPKIPVSRMEIRKGSDHQSFSQRHLLNTSTHTTSSRLLKNRSKSIGPKDFGGDGDDDDDDDDDDRISTLMSETNKGDSRHRPTSNRRRRSLKISDSQEQITNRSYHKSQEKKEKADASENSSSNNVAVPTADISNRRRGFSRQKLDSTSMRRSKTSLTNTTMSSRRFRKSDGSDKNLKTSAINQSRSLRNMFRDGDEQQQQQQLVALQQKRSLRSHQSNDNDDIDTIAEDDTIDCSVLSKDSKEPQVLAVIKPLTIDEDATIDESVFIEDHEEKQVLATKPLTVVSRSVVHNKRPSSSRRIKKVSKRMSMPGDESSSDKSSVSSASEGRRASLNDAQSNDSIPTEEDIIPSSSKSKTSDDIVHHRHPRRRSSVGESRKKLDDPTESDNHNGSDADPKNAINIDDAPKRRHQTPELNTSSDRGDPYLQEESGNNKESVLRRIPLGISTIGENTEVKSDHGRPWLTDTNVSPKRSSSLDGAAFEAQMTVIRRRKVKDLHIEENATGGGAEGEGGGGEEEGVDLTQVKSNSSEVKSDHIRPPYSEKLADTPRRKSDDSRSTGGRRSRSRSRGRGRGRSSSNRRGPPARSSSSRSKSTAPTSSSRSSSKVRSSSKADGTISGSNSGDNRSAGGGRSRSRGRSCSNRRGPPARSSSSRSKSTARTSSSRSSSKARTSSSRSSSKADGTISGSNSGDNRSAGGGSSRSRGRSCSNRRGPPARSSSSRSKSTARTSSSRTTAVEAEIGHLLSGKSTHTKSTRRLRSKTEEEGDDVDLTQVKSNTSEVKSDHVRPPYSEKLADTPRRKSDDSRSTGGGRSRSRGRSSSNRRGPPARSSSSRSKSTARTSSDVTSNQQQQQQQHRRKNVEQQGITCTTAVEAEIGDLLSGKSTHTKSTERRRRKSRGRKTRE